MTAIQAAQKRHHLFARDSAENSRFGGAVSVCLLTAVVSLALLQFRVVAAPMYDFTLVAEGSSAIEDLPFASLLGSAPSISETGRVAFEARPRVDGINEGIYIGQGGELQLSDYTTVAEDQAASSSDLRSFWVGTFAESGVAFTARDGSAGQNGIFVGDGADIQTVILDVNVSSSEPPSLNGNATTAYVTRVDDPQAGRQHALATAVENSPTILYVGWGGGTPDGRPFQFIRSPGMPVINDTSQVLFVGQRFTGETSISSVEGVYRRDQGTNFTIIAEEYGSFGEEQFNISSGRIDMNGSGVAAFHGSVTDADGDRYFAILTGNGGTLNTVVRTTDTPTPGTIDSLVEFALNDGGDVAFRGRQRDASGENVETLLVAPGGTGDSIKVIASGDTLFGSEVTHLSFARDGFNNAGQLAFRAGLADGRTVIARADPDFFRWIDPDGGQFDVGDNWQSNAVPGPADNVIFDLPATYTVDFGSNGESDEATIRRGNATFNLSGNTYQLNNLAVEAPGGENTAQLNIIGDLLSLDDALRADEISIRRGGRIRATDSQVYVGDLELTDPDERLLTHLRAEQFMHIDQGGALKLVEETEIEQTTTTILTIDGQDDSGRVTVKGPGSTVDGATVLRVGRQRSGELSITDGASVQIIGPTFVDSSTVAVDSTVEVSGFGTDADNNLIRSNLRTDNLIVGSDGAGEVLVKNRGLLESDLTVLAENAGSFGKVELQGEASRWKGVITDFLSSARIGKAGEGVLVLGPGTEIQIQQLVMGQEFGAVGRATITGTGQENASFETTIVFSELVLGSSGTGIMTVTSGADVKPFGQGSVVIGLEAGSDGELTLSDTGTILTADALHVADAGHGKLVVADDAKVVLGSSVNGVNGLLVGQTGVVEVRDGGSIESPIVNVLAGGTLDTQTGGVTIGQINFENGVVGIGTGGSLFGSGTIVGALGENGGVNNFAGQVNAGASPGALTIVGNYRQGVDGTLIVEIAGLTPDSQYDQLIVTGDATIEGDVVLRFLDGFAPHEGDVFEFLQVHGLLDTTGADFLVDNLRPGFEFDITPTATGLQIVALNDGHFVPEPGTLVLTGLCLFGIILCRHLAPLCARRRA